MFSISLTYESFQYISNVRSLINFEFLKLSTFFDLFGKNYDFQSLLNIQNSNN